MEKKSRILIIGVTGNLGRHLAEASLHFSHPTFALVRDSAFSDPLKFQTLQSLANAGVTILRGSLNDEASLIEAVKQVDVVICAVSSKQVSDQKLLINVIEESGCIKVSDVYKILKPNRPAMLIIFTLERFFAAAFGLEPDEVRKLDIVSFLCSWKNKLRQSVEADEIPLFIPAEFGSDPDRVQILAMDYNFYSRKSEIRRLVEAKGIPHTYVSCNFYMSYLLPSLIQPGRESPPMDKVTVFGDGNTKGVFVKESDVAAFTISAVDDPRTLNKVLYLRPPGNVYSINELVQLWESKIGKKLERIYVSETDLLEKIKETPYPDNMELIFIYSGFVKGDQTYFDIDLSANGVDGTKLYPQLKHTTISDFLNTLLS